MDKNTTNFQINYAYDKVKKSTVLNKVTIKFPKRIIEHASCIKHIEIKGEVDNTIGGSNSSQGRMAFGQRNIGGSFHSPGRNPGGSTFNPGNIGGSSYNPGLNPGGSSNNPWQNPGGSSYNPGQNPGGSNYNPGHNPGGSNYNPGHNPGGSDYNPGGSSSYNPSSNSKDTCVYTCEWNGGCKVTLQSNKFTSGYTMGSCFPPSYGGSCSGNAFNFCAESHFLGSFSKQTCFNTESV